MHRIVVGVTGCFSVTCNVFPVHVCMCCLHLSICVCAVSRLFCTPARTPWDVILDEKMK